MNIASVPDPPLAENVLHSNIKIAMAIDTVIVPFCACIDILNIKAVLLIIF